MKTLLLLLLLLLALALALPLTAADRNVTLTWDAQTDATSFAVYTSTGARLTLVATNVATITVADRVSTTVYVTAINEHGESEPSTSLTILITPPGKPQNVKVTKVVKAP